MTTVSGTDAHPWGRTPCGGGGVWVMRLVSWVLPGMLSGTRGTRVERACAGCRVGGAGVVVLRRDLGAGAGDPGVDRSGGGRAASPSEAPAEAPAAAADEEVPELPGAHQVLDLREGGLGDRPAEAAHVQHLLPGGEDVLARFLPGGHGQQVAGAVAMRADVVVEAL